MNNMYFSLLFLLFVLCSSCDISNPDTNSKPYPIVDIDGNGYDSVQIGNQFWLNSNFKVTHFRNGDPIPEAKTALEWIEASEQGKPAYCYYDNNPFNALLYGKLYNWYAITDTRGLAPLGWHIPTDEELIQLGNDVNNDGGSIKSNSGWQNGANGTNTSRFYALPGGFRSYNGSFSFIEYFGRFISIITSPTCLILYIFILFNSELNLYKSKESSIKIETLYFLFNRSCAMVLFNVIIQSFTIPLS